MSTGGGRLARTCRPTRTPRVRCRRRPAPRRRPAAGPAGCRRRRTPRRVPGARSGVSPTTAAMTAEPAAMRKPLAMCGTAAGSTTLRNREFGLPPSESTTSRADGFAACEARARVHEDRVEDHHRGEEPHGGRLVADDAGEEREEGDERSRRHQDDERDRHAGQQPRTVKPRAPRRDRPRCRWRARSPPSAASQPWPRGTRRATRRCPPSTAEGRGTTMPRDVRQPRSTPTRR